MWRRALFAAAAIAAFAGTGVRAGNEELCSLSPGTYESAKKSHPDAEFALAELEKRGIAMWYTDRSGSYLESAKQVIAKCPSSSRVTIVVYGLPNKDCEAGASSSGSVKNSAAYQSFLSQLQQTVGDRKVLYIVEPDALGLLAKSSCAKTNNYAENLATAIRTLSQNPNADLYLDVGHWVLQSPTDLANVVSYVKSLQNAGRLKGISINTSNYRSNAELSSMCASFRQASGSNLHCVIDTSRNGNGPSGLNEWCNYKNAAIGSLPTGSTGDANIDYYIWVKPPGESDGQCNGMSSDAMKGPVAGQFFPDYFKQLWNSGSLVKQLGLPKIDGTIHQVSNTETSATSTATETPAGKISTPTKSAAAVATNATTSKSADFSNATTSSSDVASDADTEAGTVAPASIEKVDDATATQAITTTTAPDNTQSEVKTQSSGGGTSTTLYVLVAMVGVAAVALVVVVGFRVRQSRLDDDKSPMELDPRIHYLGRFDDAGAL